MTSTKNKDRTLFFVVLGLGATAGIWYLASKRRGEPPKDEDPLFEEVLPRRSSKLVHFEEETTDSRSKDVAREAVESPTKASTLTSPTKPSPTLSSVMTPVRSNIKGTAAGSLETTVPVQSTIQDPALQQSFDEATERVRSMENLSNQDKLMLYGLYKQTTVGDADPVFSPLRSSSWNIMAEKAKHTAWLEYRGIPKDMAATGYLALVQDLEAESGAGTPHKNTVSVVDDNPLGGKAVSLPQPDHDASESSRDAESGEGRLLHAALYNKVDDIKHLVEHEGVDKNYGDDQGQTALHLAADRGNKEAVEALIALKADVNARDKDGISVLQAAVIGGAVDVCRQLLEAGSYADQFDFDGDTPRSCAQDYGDEDMLKLFEEYD